MQFTPVAVAKTTGGNVGVSDAVKSDVDEAWEWFKANADTHLFTDEFATDAEKDSWVRQAQAHAKTLGLRLRVVRDDALKESIEAGHSKPKVRIHIETQEAFEARQEAARAQKAANDAIKAAGGEVKRGRKAASATQKNGK